MIELFNATIHNDLPRVKELVQSGADFNFKDNIGDTALIWASYGGCFDVAEYLVQSGADINAQNNFGEIAVIWASRKKHLEIVKLLAKAGADLNATDGNWTALMHASSIGHIKIVKYLVRSGADINIKSNIEETALTIAKRLYHHVIFDFIEQYPAYLAAVRELIPLLAPRISLASCARIFEFV